MLCESPPKSLDSNVDTVSKILKLAMAASMVLWFGMTILLEEVILMDTEGGFVYAPQDPEAQLLLYAFAGVSVMNLILQFIVPNWMRIRQNTASGHLSAALVRFALCESVAVLGFLLFLLNGQKLESWIFISLALLALLFGDRQARKAL